MALALDADGIGPFAVVECDAPGCERHVAARPAEAVLYPRELLEVALGWALDEGWLVAGLAWCPLHRGAAEARLPGTVGEGQSWAPVASRLGYRAPRPS